VFRIAPPPYVTGEILEFVRGVVLCAKAGSSPALRACSE